ncbi:MAG: disulfide bond formation protein B [Kiloniellales bacterium]
MPATLMYPALLLAASAAILGTAYASQYIGGLEPCSLCLYQRVPYWVAIGLTAAALALAGRRRLQGLALIVVGAVFLFGTGLALYHVGVEQHLFAGPPACSADLGQATTIEELRAQLIGQPVVRCDEVAWSLFGISMAGYNAIASLGLTAAALWAGRALASEPPP